MRKRILLECRYLISLHKSVKELSKIFQVSERTIYEDLTTRLYSFDKELYYRIRDIRE